jgi:hypothetical protein
MALRIVGLFFAGLVWVGFTVHAATPEATNPPWSYTVYAPPFLLIEHDATGLPELTGFDIAQGGSSVQSSVPRLIPSHAAEFRLYWRPWVPMAKPLRVRILIRAVGIDPSPAYWAEGTMDLSNAMAGVLSPQTISVPMPVRRFVGDGTLTIQMSLEADPIWDRTPVAYKGALFVEPGLWESQSDSKVVQELYSSRGLDLRSAFRLGPGTEITCAIPDSMRHALIGVGLVSNVSWARGLRADTPIATVEALNDAGHMLATGIVHLGQETGRDRTLNENRPGPRLAWLDETGSGEPLYVYAEEVEFGAAVRPSRIRVKYIADRGMLDVTTLVLLPAELPE